MFNFCKNKKIFKLLIAVAFMVVSVSVFAIKSNGQITDVLSRIPSSSTQSNDKNLNKSSPNSSVVLDFSIATGESWDSKDSSNNVIENCINGSSITGFEYNNVTIKTVGGSFFSEAVMYFSDSNNGNNGLRLTAGAGDESSGTKTFNSNGILDLTDNGLEDIVSLNDGQFIIQLYENIDDAPSAIDARYTDGTVTVWGVDLSPTNDCLFLMGDGQTDSDLSVTYTVSQSQEIDINDPIEFIIQVANNGNDSATNVYLSNSLSEKLIFNQMSCNDGTSTTNANEIVSLSVQDIASSDSLQCNIEATVIAYGSIQNSVSVSADNDSNPNNNEASAITSGAFRVVPINNPLTLMILILTVIFFARKRVTNSY